MAISRRPARTTPGAKGVGQEDLSLKRIQYPNGSSNQYLKFFASFGVTVVAQREQLQGDCPFLDCKKEGHFYASSASGLWDCKRCGKSGNIFTFMSFLHTSHNRVMTEKDYNWIAKQRPGISITTLKKYGICRFGPSSVLIPSYNLEGKIASLPIWRELSNPDNTVSHRILNPPIVKAALFGLQFVKSASSVYICEGQWDMLALHSAFSTVTVKAKPLLSVSSLLAVPGAGTFPQQHLSLLDNRDIFILFDNDSAGLKGVESLLNAISRHGVTPRKIQSLAWPTHYPTHFDIRDLISKGVQ